MTATWEPIRRTGHPEVRGEASPRRLLVYVPLSDTPPPEWRDHFVYQYAKIHDPDDEWRLPEIAGAAIIIRPLDPDLADWIRIVDERIEKANAYYKDSVIPDQERREAAARQSERMQQGRLDAAKRTAEEL